MRRRPRREVIDTKAQLSSAVMQYLGEYRRRKGNVVEDTSSADRKGELFTWKQKDSEADKPVAAKQGTNVEPKLRVSNLLSKAAAAKSEETATGNQTTVEHVPYNDPYNTPLRQSVHDWQRFWGSPVISSAALGLIPAAAYWGINKFTSPDDPKENTEIQNIAYQIAKEDKKAGIPIRDARHYIQAAIERHAKRRWKIAALVGLGSAALLHTQHINPKDWTELVKYPTVPGVRHNASMFGPGVGPMPIDDIRSSVMFNNQFSPDLKDSAMRVLDYAPSAYMTSSDIVSNAIHSGESGRTGLPMGRLITSAVADGAIGYGLGKIFGAGNPKRLGILTGIGSALYNALSY